MNSEEKTLPWGELKPLGWKGPWLGFCQKIPNRRLALWARKPLKKALDALVDTEVWGLRLRLQSRGNLSEQRLLMMPRHLDPREREIVAGELANGGVFLDIGANAGLYTLWLASRKISGLRIEAFEPDPALCGRLRFNVAENELAQVTLNPFALGAEAGILRLAPGKGNQGENSLVSEGAGHPVEVKTLKAVLSEKNISEITALKIDIEGHEAEVLRPFFATAPKSLWPKLVVCELNLDSQRTKKSPGHLALGEAGYRVDEETRMNGIFRL